VIKSEVQSYRLDICYDGRTFVGFQIQNNGETIQDTLQQALKIFFSEPIKLTGASRTDSGVHAENQVTLFRTDKKFDKKRWIQGLNSLTPRSIGILDIRPVGPEFHPITHSKAKIYRYRVWRGNCANPFVAPYVWEVHQQMDLKLLEEAAAVLVGEYDFTSFCNTDTDVLTKVRSILDIKIEHRGQLTNIWISGDGFLKQMVRIMAGTMVDIAIGRFPEGAMPSLLAAKDRTLSGRTAPAQALSLVKIFYDEALPSIENEIKAADQGFTLASF
jgi:tRNA pseudouridine38-40 synthase